MWAAKPRAPRGHTCHPNGRRREEPCPIRHTPPVPRTGLQMTSDAPGGERQLFISRVEVRRYPATSLHFQFGPWVLLSFLPKTRLKRRRERGVASSYGAVRAAFAKLPCHFPRCRGGLEVLQVPQHPGTRVETCLGLGTHSCITTQG